MGKVCRGKGFEPLEFFHKIAIIITQGLEIRFVEVRKVR
jgi:hypothetical protein